MNNISFELYEDNAGRYHLFAINEDGIPFAGFETTQKADILSAIVGADELDAEDPSNWNYQTAILVAIQNAMDEEAKWVERKVKRDNGWEKLTPKRREAVDAALAESEDWAIYKKLYDECRGYYPAWE